MDITHELGMRIRHYRKVKKITQEQLAEICGLHPTYIGQLERGEKNATIESIYRIALGLHIPMSKLFEDMETLDDSLQNIPSDIYHQVLSLPHEKQYEIMQILSNIIKLLSS